MKVTIGEARTLLRDIFRATFRRQKNAPENNVTIKEGITRSTKNMLQPHQAELEKLTATYKRPLVIAQKGDTLLVNTGAYTSWVALDELEDPTKSVMDTIAVNFYKNHNLSTRH